MKKTNGMVKKNLMVLKEIFKNKGNPLDLEFNRDLTFDPQESPKNMFVCEIGKHMC